MKTSFFFSQLNDCQSSHSENTSLFTPAESQKQFIMALRIKTKSLRQSAGPRRSQPSLALPLWVASSSSSTMQTVLPQAHLFQTRTAAAPRVWKVHPHLSLPPTPTPPVCLDNCKSPFRYCKKHHFLREYFGDWIPSPSFLYFSPLQLWNYLQLYIYLCHYFLNL